MSEDPTIVFETKAATKVADKTLVFVFALAAFPLAILLPVGLGVLAVEMGVPSWLALLVGLIVLRQTLRLVWYRVAQRLRFCYVFHTTHLQIGRGWVRCDLRYDEIDEVWLRGSGDRRSWVGMRSGKDGSNVYLRPQDATDCFRLLVRLCSYAVFVDQEGQAHVRVLTDRPDRILQNLERLHRRHAIYCLMATLFFGARVAGVSVVVFRWLRGDLVLGAGDKVWVLVNGLFYLLGTVVCAWSAWSMWRKARRERRERLSLAAEHTDAWPG